MLIGQKSEYCNPSAHTLRVNNFMDYCIKGLTLLHVIGKDQFCLENVVDCFFELCTSGCFVD